MSADVEKAVERVGYAIRGIWEPQAEMRDDWAKITQALRDQEAEIARLRRNLQAYVDNNWLLPAPMIRDLLNGAEIYTAHLGAEQ